MTLRHAASQNFQLCLRQAAGVLQLLKPLAQFFQGHDKY
jgi:hypothetical protein